MKKLSSRFILTVGFLALTASGHLGAQDNPASAAAAFALVSPAMAKGLACKMDAPEAAGFIKSATRGLTGIPHPIARIHLEGTLPHQGIWDQSKVAVADFENMRDLALACRLTGDDRYLHAVDGYLVAWTPVYKISLNPIDETNFDNFILAYDLVKDALPDSTRQIMTPFLRHMAEGYAGAVVQKKSDTGNWQSHRIKILTLAAFALGDEDLIGKAHEAFSEHLKVNIRPDGSVYDFYKRDAMHYVVYDLEPLSFACLAAKAHGRDWFNEAAPGSVAKAIDWMLPYATGQKTHMEFVHSDVKFDKARAAAGIGEYAPHQWEPAASITLLTQAAAIDPTRREVCQQVAATANKNPTGWLVLLFWPQNGN